MFGVPIGASGKINPQVAKNDDALRKSETKPSSKEDTCTEKLTFMPSETMGPMRVFKIFVVIFSFLTTVWAAYFAAFGFPKTTGWMLSETIIELFFLVDIILNFLTRFREEDF